MQPWEDGPDLALPSWRGRWVERVRGWLELRPTSGETAGTETTPQYFCVSDL